MRIPRIGSGATICKPNKKGEAWYKKYLIDIKARKIKE